jgi:acyl dehydratase
MSTQSDHRSLTEFSDLAEFTAADGTELGPTDWLLVDQARIDQFAHATDDHQWIHVDPERAANGPYGSTIAHGLLTLSTTIEVEGSDKRAAVVESIVDGGLT